MLTEIHWSLKNVYVNMTLNVSIVWRWVCVSNHGSELKDIPWKWHKRVLWIFCFWQRRSSLATWLCSNKLVVILYMIIKQYMITIITKKYTYLFSTSASFWLISLSMKSESYPGQLISLKNNTTLGISQHLMLSLKLGFKNGCFFFPFHHHPQIHSP